MWKGKGQHQKSAGIGWDQLEWFYSWYQHQREIDCKNDYQGQCVFRRCYTRRIAMLEQCCNHSTQCRNNAVMLCCAKNRCCESSRATYLCLFTGSLSGEKNSPLDQRPVQRLNIPLRFKQAQWNTSFYDSLCQRQFACLETRRKLGRINFRKDSWDCY